jgi:hypothetical protein
MTAGPIARVTNISAEAFLRDYFATRTPVIIEGHLQCWRALEIWTPANLAARLANTIVIATVFDRPVAQPNLDRAMRTVAMHFNHCLAAVADEASPNLCALPGYPVSSLCEDLLADIPAPAVTRCIAGAAPFFWLGPKGKMVPLHRDRSDGLLGQVFGCKQVTLVSPEAGVAAYPMPANPLLSQVLDPAAPDLTRYPAFAELARHQGTLNPGDMLYIPEGWWHSVVYSSLAISINYWPASYLDPLPSPRH